jgi:hypothetical protein
MESEHETIFNAFAIENHDFSKTNWQILNLYDYAMNFWSSKYVVYPKPFFHSCTVVVNFGVPISTYFKDWFGVHRWEWVRPPYSIFHLTIKRHHMNKLWGFEGLLIAFLKCVIHYYSRFPPLQCLFFAYSHFWKTTLIVDWIFGCWVLIFWRCTSLKLGRYYLNVILTKSAISY